MVVPSFDLTDSGGIGLVLIRGLTDAVVLTLFGTLAFRALVAPAGFTGLGETGALAFRRRLAAQTRLLASLALVVLAVWLVLIAQSLAEVTGFAPTVGAVWTVIGSTSFGHIVIAEAAMLVAVLATLALPEPWDRSALAFGAMLTALQACHGHAFGMGNPLLLACLVAHLLAAGVWLGSLPALAISLARLPHPVAARLAQRFSPVGITCVSILAVTALYQGWVLIGSWGLLASSAYGWAALLKILLFALLLALAGFNRIYATPRLALMKTDGAGRPALLYAVGLEIGLGIAIILAAGLLASLPPPGMKM
ncbi:CopD family protein [Acidisoma cellulosilytica]|uniref:CopD family protein n=1 Tax=Acidisoma cellulosilyticum TaxID=2802395 RepID=A0A963Z6L1_9PROT|nr:CopD family protein [Acidisoma cellulosilyticum]MCB8883834.1 CopD family protein [Acidisoma cellulosilyticum]